MAGPIRIDVETNARAAGRQLDDMASRTSRLGSKLKTLGKGIALGVGGGLLAAAAAGVKFAQAAAEDEKGASRMAQTFRRAAGATDEQVAATERWITKQGKALGVADDDLRPALARLVTATKDVGEAQKLTSLAMDVSAGSGKSLEQVSTALMKAQNGNVAALSRLGINTKNAAGETIGMEEATRRMSALFGGAAKTNAGTLSGQWERLKLRASEAGESIGAAFLPILLKLVKLIASRGVPMLEDFAGWLSENSDEIKRLAVDGGTKAVAVIRDFADVVRTAVNFIQDLPDPVKQSAVQIAIAAAVLPKLTTGLTLAQTATSGLIAKQALLRAEMVAGAGPLAATRTALAGFSGVAKQAAGIGGLLLLTNGLKQAKDEGTSFSSVMKGAAGGAGIGAMFGPIGALVGAGVGGGLAALVGSLKETTEEASNARIELLKTQGFKNAREDADTLRDSLTGVANAYGKIPRAAVKASFINADGKLDADVQLLRDAGVSMDTIVSATMGRRDAQRLVNQALTESVAPLRAQADQAKAAYDDVRDGMRDVVTASGQIIKNGEQLTSDEVEIYKNAWIKASEAVKSTEANQATFNKRIEANTGVLRENRELVAQLAGDLGLTVKQYKALPKNARTKIEADGLPETLKDSLKLIGQYKGLQDFRAIRAIVEATDAKLTTEQVKELTRRYDLTPKQVKTLVQAVGVDRETEKVRRLRLEAENAAGTYNVNVHTAYTYSGLRGGGGSGPTRGRDDDFSPRRAAEQGQDFGALFTRGVADGVDKGSKDAEKKAEQLAERITNRLKQKLESARGVRDALKSLTSGISDSLTGDLFSGENDETGTALDKFRAAVNAAKATAAQVAAAVRSLNGRVSPAFLQSLVASGNSDLIVQLAGAPDAAALAAAFGDVVATNDSTGRVVAEEVIGRRLDTVNQTIKELMQKLAERDKKDRETQRTVSVRLTSEQRSQLERGRDIRLDLDVFDRSGGRQYA